MLASNVMFGQSPLTPWQMFSMGIIGFLAGILFRKGLLMRTRGALCSFGALCAILFYGGIMNAASALTANRELTGGILLSSYVVGMPFDCIHAMATWLFLWFAPSPCWKSWIASKSSMVWQSEFIWEHRGTVVSIVY